MNIYTENSLESDKPQ